MRPRASLRYSWTMSRAQAPEGLCFRHPTRPARRKCFHCRRSICPRCQMRSEGHIFCSDHCVRGHRRHVRWERFSRWNRTALHGWWLRVLLLAALLSAGGATLWLSTRFDRFLYTPPEVGSSLRPKRASEAGIDRERLDWDAEGPVVIEQPAPGAAVQGNRLTVEGRAPREAMVGLYVNGQRQAVQLSADGAWRFEGIPLPARQTLLQARYFDNRGNSAFSPAVLVTLAPSLPPAPPLPEVIPEPELPPAPALDIARASTDRKEVLLTFDGGSNANSTPAILDILKAHGIRATMFLTGEFIQRYPELVRRIAREGHTVGNHTFSHPHLTSFSFNGRQSTLPGVTPEFLHSQLSRAAGLYQLATDRTLSPYWRAPFGEYNGAILRWGADAGWRHVYWTPHMDTLDWVANPSDPLFRTPAQILAGLLRQSRQAPAGMNGGIVLMHLGTEREGESRADTVLESLVKQLEADGYGFVPVDRAQIAP